MRQRMFDLRGEYILTAQAQVKAMRGHRVHADRGIADQRKARRDKLIRVDRDQRV